MIRYDIKFDKDYINANNDVEWFESDTKHVKDIINSNVGEWKETPSLGVGITKYLSSSGQEQTISRTVIIQLQSDLYPCNNPTISYDVNNKLTINPNFEL